MHAEACGAMCRHRIVVSPCSTVSMSLFTVLSVMAAPYTMLSVSDKARRPKLLEIWRYKWKWMRICLIFDNKCWESYYCQWYSVTTVYTRKGVDWELQKRHVLPSVAQILPKRHTVWSIFRFSVSRHTRMNDGTHKIGLISFIRSYLTPFAGLWLCRGTIQLKLMIL